VFGLVMGADNAAHIGGMASGAALGYFLPPTQNSRSLGRDMKIWNAAAVASFVIMAVCFGFAAHFYFFTPL
jgi:rhomboid protease GluP